jgi:tetratricopeptide (TPR) repeat protein
MGGMGTARADWRRRWGFAAVGMAVAIALLGFLLHLRERGWTAGSRPLPDEPHAAMMAAYLEQVRAGVSAYRANRYAAATHAFETALRLRPSEPLPHRYLAELHWRQGRPEQAAQAVRSLAEAMPDAYALDQVGRLYEEAGLGALALQVYQEAVRLDPRFPSARYNLGRAYLAGGDLERGIAAMQETLRLHPEFPEAHQALGMAYSEQGRWADAIAHLRRALELNADLTAVRNHLGRIYLAQGRLDEAVQTFRSLVERAPEVAEAHHNLAVAYARQGLQELAMAQFREALRLRPDLHAARLDLAALLLERRHPQGAIDTLRAGLSTGFQDSAASADADLLEMRYRLGIAYWMAGQPAEAIRELETVLQAQPEHAGAHAYLGRLYYQMRQFDRAWRHARRAEALGVPMAELLAALRRVAVEPP